MAALPIAAAVGVVGGALALMKVSSEQSSNESSKKSGPVKVGEPAPEFCLVDATDWKTNVKLSALKGNKVVLAFFPNAFSGAPDDGCEMQLCSLKELAAKGYKVYGISHDWAFQLKAFHAKIELNYPLLCDPSRATIEEYVGTFDKGAFFDKLGLFTPDAARGPMPAGKRGMVVIDEEGKVIHVEVNPDGPGPVATKQVKAALGPDKLQGLFTDPGHYKPGTWEGVRMVSDATGTTAGDVITLVGSDDGVTFWTLKGKFSDKAAGKLIIDFSPKGGPANLEATWGNGKLTFPDGNAWTQQSAPPGAFK